jgi:CheY-like chemotaxis protein
VVDGDLSAADQTAVIAAARARQPAPLVFMAAPPGSVRHDRVDGMLVKPSSADDARALVEICVRAKIPSRVLIVDDSATMRSIVRKILSASRFALDIHEAAEGIAALNQLRGGNFGMVFLDYNMPGLNGFETLAEIKRECPTVAVVMMTSTLDNAIADRAHAAGALAFLKKPFYPADIDKVLERYYSLHVPRD